MEAGGQQRSAHRCWGTTQRCPFGRRWPTPALAGGFGAVPGDRRGRETLVLLIPSRWPPPLPAVAGPRAGGGTAPVPVPVPVPVAFSPVVRHRLPACARATLSEGGTPLRCRVTRTHHAMDGDARAERHEGKGWRVGVAGQASSHCATVHRAPCAVAPCLGVGGSVVL
jgi:hypothetical protein